MNSWEGAKQEAEDKGFIPGSNEYFSYAVSIFKPNESDNLPYPEDGELFFINNPHIRRPGLIVELNQSDIMSTGIKNKLNIEVL